LQAKKPGQGHGTHTTQTRKPEIP